MGESFILWAEFKQKDKQQNNWIIPDTDTEKQYSNIIKIFSMSKKCKASNENRQVTQFEFMQKDC